MQMDDFIKKIVPTTRSCSVTYRAFIARPQVMADAGLMRRQKMHRRVALTTARTAASAAAGLTRAVGHAVPVARRQCIGVA
jgi:hypothetical protein